MMRERTLLQPEAEMPFRRLTLPTMPNAMNNCVVLCCVVLLGD